MCLDTTTTVRELSSPLATSLLSIHPNDVTLLGREHPPEWSSWWEWASLCHPGRAPAWLELMHYFTREDDGPSMDIPPQLCSLIDSVRNLQLQRTPLAYETRSIGDRSYRISPKKEHEVDRMSSYIRHMVHSQGPRSVWHAVDIGSGQGYLSRALQELDFHVLALDNNENQTSGASQWMTRETAHKLKKEHRMRLQGTRKPTRDPSIYPSVEHPQRKDSHLQNPVGARTGSLTHQTVHVCPRALEGSIAGWLIDAPGFQVHDTLDGYHHPGPVPVTLVALHACGSLSIDVLRTFLSNRARASQTKDERAWTPHSLVVVGCCYNLMSPSDFPLSASLRGLDPMPKLTTAAVHLAAQVPFLWLKNEDAKRSAELALRKVVYRALLQPVLQAAALQSNAAPGNAVPLARPIQPGLGETQENRRMGKLNDKAYQDWPTFLERSTDKLGIDLAAINGALPDWFVDDAVRMKMESALSVLQTLRCILGPLIETLILLDRRDWIRQELAEMNDCCGQEMVVEIVNLFDQSTGSGRNVALVVRPVTRVCPEIERGQVPGGSIFRST